MHDLLEDTDLTPTDLICAGCPPHVVVAVEDLTRAPGESYDRFCLRASHNRIARAVKLADIADNANGDRLALLEPELATRLRSKYQRAQLIILRTRPRRTQSRRDREADFATIGIPQEEGEAWATFWCGLCGRPAGTLTLIASEEALVGTPGHRLVITSFLGSMAPDVHDDELETVQEMLERGDANWFYRRDEQLAPFWCRQCRMSYCDHHWNRETLFDEGFFDEVVGTCPGGHRRTLWD